jgi:hypothetical protein
MQPLADLQRSFRVYAVCAPCGRMEPLPVRELLDRFGAAVTLTEIRLRLRCKVCGKRSGDLRIVYVGPEDRPVVFQYGIGRD